jgi:hypothetical protein
VSASPSALALSEPRRFIMAGVAGRNSILKGDCWRREAVGLGLPQPRPARHEAWPKGPLEAQHGPQARPGQHAAAASHRLDVRGSVLSSVRHARRRAQPCPC